jgi:hypothetical protein
MVHEFETKDALALFKKYSKLIPYKLIKKVDFIQLPDGRMAEVQIVVTAKETDWLTDNNSQLLTEINP